MFSAAAPSNQPRGAGLSARRESFIHQARNRSIAAVVCALVGAAGFVQTVVAEETKPGDFTEQSLEELMQVKIPVVVAAAKHEQKVTDAPASVSVVTRDDIEKFGYRSLSDILRSVRGYYITSDEIYSYIGIQGVNRPGDYGGRVLVMVDGHRMNEPLYDQAFNGHDLPLDVDLIQRVEVIRGPGSSLYGNNAALGVVNIVTREANSWNGVEAAITGGSLETFTGRLSYGREFTNGLKLILSGSILESQGREAIYYPEFQSVNGGIAVDRDAERARKFFGLISWGDLTLEGSYGDRRRDIPNGAYGIVFNAGPAYADDERAFVELRYRHEFAHDWLITARVYYDHYRFQGDLPYPPEVSGDPLVVNYDYGADELLGSELQAAREFSPNHRLTLGVEWNHTFEVRQINYDLAPPLLYSDVRTDGDNLGVYAQDEYKLARHLTLNAGVRYDWYSSFGDTINPRTALIYQPAAATTLKAVYGQAFRAPNAYEFDYVAPGYAANHALEPEKIRTGKLVWEQGLGRNYRCTVAGFYTDLSDLITQQADGVSGDFRFVNLDHVVSRGVEAEIEAVWQGGWRARASYSFAEARNEETHQRLSNSPQHLTKLNLVAPLWREKLFAGIEVQGMSERETVSGSQVPGHVICNATLFARELARNLDLSASIYNVFDRQYADPVSGDFVQGAIQQPGRLFRLKLTYRF